MKKMNLIAILVMIISLGMCGCSIVRKNKEFDTDNPAPITPVQKTNGDVTNIPKQIDPLLEEVVIKPEIEEIGPRSIAYFSSWCTYTAGLAVKDMDPTLLTHINFAFANVKEDGEVIVGDENVDLKMDFGTELGGNKEDSYGHFGQLRQLKVKYPHIKVLISIGGWSWSQNFSDVAADPVKRDKFAESAAAFVAKYGFDGVDIDWEYPVEGGDNITHRPEDRENYLMLLKATRKALNVLGEEDGKTYLLTIAARAAERFINDANLLEAMNYINFINLMTYDFHGAWESVTGFNAPLYDASGGPACIDYSVKAFLDAGINAKDINLGLAFYGRGWSEVASLENNGVNQAALVPTAAGFGLGTWSAGSFDAWDIMENYVDKNGYIRYYDKIAQCPYVFDGVTWIGYDDPQSIKAKTEYAIEKGLGGVMFWDFTGDMHLVLQKTIANTLGLKEEE
jgi:chitinase